VQNYNGGILPDHPNQVFNNYAVVIVNSLATDLDSDGEPDDFDDYDVVTDNQPFIGVASQSKSNAVIAYYGIENHSKWIFTPLWRGNGRNWGNPIRQQFPQAPQPPQPGGGRR
jgi:hypothetical protein